MPVKCAPPPEAAVPLIQAAIRHKVAIERERLSIDELRRIARYELGLSPSDFNALVKRYLK